MITATELQDAFPRHHVSTFNGAFHLRKGGARAALVYWDTEHGGWVGITPASGLRKFKSPMKAAEHATGEKANSAEDPSIIRALRAELAESEKWRSNLSEGLNGAYTQVAALKARLAESEKTATRYRRLFEGRCLDCSNLDPVHAPDCAQVTGKVVR